MKPVIIIIEESVVNTVIPCTKEDCEVRFLKECADRIWNFNEYTDSDKADILEQGFETWGNGNSINLTWIEI